eukprot:8537569-Lingulodinium_polyedra.AAC.1
MFETKCGMLAHVRQCHGLRAIFSLATATNQCFWCRTILCSRDVAVKHVQVSADNGVCQVDRTPIPNRLMEPEGELCCCF